MKGAHRRPRRKLRARRGVFLLPALFTVANVFCGFAAIIQATSGKFFEAAALIVVAAVLDGLDGRIARLTGSTSEFGLQFDSIADTVSFGVAPAYLGYVWGVGILDRIGWALVFLYLICAAARLARFNIQHAISDNRFFRGLPSPPAACVLAAVVLNFPMRITTPAVAAIPAALILALALLMVSPVQYRSFKDIDLRSRRSYLAIVPIAAVLVGFLLEPAVVVLGLASVYFLSGPVTMLFPGSRVRRSPVNSPDSTDATGGRIA